MRRFFTSIASVLVAIGLLGCGSSSSGNSSSSTQVDLSTIDGATDVAVDSTFVYNFSSDVAADTVGASTFYIFPTAMASASISKAAYDAATCNSNLAIAATVMCSTSKACTLAPQSSLSSSMRYTICLSPEILYGGGDVFEGFSATFTTAAAADACDLTMSFAGPSTPSAIQTLGEDPVKCAMTSWREYFIDSEPESSAIFISSNCGQDSDGGLNKPYCSIAEALVQAAVLYQHEITPELYIDPGEYAMNLNLKSELADIKIFGLCSQTTTISPTDVTVPLIKQDAAVNILFRALNVTLTSGNTVTIDLSNGDVSLDQVEVVQGSNNECFVISGSQANLAIDRLIMSGTATSVPLPAATTTSEADVMNFVQGAADLEKCIIVENGGMLLLEDFSVSDFRGIGIYVTGQNSSATLTSGSVSGILPRDSADPSVQDGVFGYGIAIDDGASASLDQVSLTQNSGANLFIDGSGSSAIVNNSYVGEAIADVSGATGVGIMLQRGATGTFSFINIMDNKSAGVVISPDSQASISDSSFSGNGFSNIVITNSEATLTRNVFGEAVAHASEGGPIGLFIQGRNGGGQTTAQISNNIIENNPFYGIDVVELSTGNMNLSFEANYLHDNATISWSIYPSFLTYAVSGTMNIDENCIVSGSTESPALLVDSGSNVSAYENIIMGTYDGYAIHQQRCGDPPVDPIDISAQTLPASSTCCICGTNPSTGEDCESPYGLGPMLEFKIMLAEDQPVGQINSEIPSNER